MAIVVVIIVITGIRTMVITVIGITTPTVGTTMVDPLPIIHPHLFIMGRPECMFIHLVSHFSFIFIETYVAG